MKWALSIAGVLAFSFVLCGVVGFLLRNPRTTEMKVNLSVPIDTVWRLISDPEKQTEWRSDLVRVELRPVIGGYKTWTEPVKSGPPVTFKETEVVRNTRYALEIIPTMSFEGRSTIDLSMNNDGTTIRFVEVSIVSNPYRRVLSYIFYHPRQRMEVYVRDLSKAASPGELRLSADRR